MSEINPHDVAFEVGREVVDKLLDFSFSSGGETLVMGSSMASGFPGVFLFEVIGKYQERAMRGKITEENGIETALHNLRYLAATSAYMAAKIAEKHTLLSLKLEKQLSELPSKKTALLAINREDVLLNEDDALEANEMTVELMKGNAKPAKM